MLELQQLERQTVKLKIPIIFFVIAATSSWRAGAQTYDTNNVVVQTFAGSGFSGHVDGVGELTMFSNPSRVVSASSSNLFVLDVNNSRLRKIEPNGTVSTFVGGGNQWPTGSGTGASLIVNANSAMAIDHADTIWIVTTTGYLIRIGTDASMSATLLNGLSVPAGGCVDTANNIYISDQPKNKIYRLRNGILEVFAGSGNQGSADGNGIFTSFHSPTALAADAADNIYVWDSGNRKIRRISQNRDVVTLTGGAINSADGQDPSFNSVSAMCVDSFGNLILACGTAVRKMSVATNAVTLAGSFTQTGYVNGAGNLSRFSGATGVCLSQGMIFVADSANQRIRQISFDPPTEVVSGSNLGIGTFAGVTITGSVGRTYQVQSSPDTTNWTTRATLLLTSSPYLWIDQNPVGGSRFYRALLLP
jgi:sugar lactone lactonase YvrE